jgi:hypothetical protein
MIEKEAVTARLPEPMKQVESQRESAIHLRLGVLSFLLDLHTACSETFSELSPSLSLLAHSNKSL